MFWFPRTIFKESYKGQGEATIQQVGGLGRVKGFLIYPTQQFNSSTAIVKQLLSFNKKLNTQLNWPPCLPLRCTKVLAF